MPGEIKQVIVVRKDLNMRKGKIAAQVAHASMSFIVKGSLADWRKADPSLPPDRRYVLHKVLSELEGIWLAEDDFTKIVAAANSEQELVGLILKAREAGIVVHDIYDAGRTEFHGVKTLTCAAFGPAEVERLDPITGGCKLL